MQLILNIIKKILQLTELKQLIMSKNQNSQHDFIDDKHSLKDDKYLLSHKFSAAVEKTRNVLLNDSRLTSEKIDQMNIT